MNHRGHRGHREHRGNSKRGWTESIRRIPPSSILHLPPSSSSLCPLCSRCPLCSNCSPLYSGLPPRPILPAPQLLRLLIPDDLPRLRVQVNRPPRPPGDVGQVAERGGQMPLLDLGVELLRVVRPHRVEEILTVPRVAAAPRHLRHFLVLQVVD